MRELEQKHEIAMMELRLKYERTEAAERNVHDESGSRTSCNENDDKDDSVTRRQVMARKCIPKHLPLFDGDAESWPLFYGSFQDTTAACGFTNLENLQRLRDCLRGQALEAVKGRLLLPEAVPSVIEDLRSLFGKPERLLRRLLEKVRNTPAPDPQRLETFLTFGIAVKQLCDHLQASKMADHLSNPLLVDELVEKLPTTYKMEWDWITYMCLPRLRLELARSTNQLVWKPNSDGPYTGQTSLNVLN
uniref:Uncharacterized protein n=1 Tax=Anopheles albimanus TaxID=7167 RepID=A0A182FPA8_ANOAL